MIALRPSMRKRAAAARDGETSTHGTPISRRGTRAEDSTATGAAAGAAGLATRGAAGPVGVTFGRGVTGAGGAGTAVTTNVRGSLELPAASVPTTVIACSPGASVYCLPGLHGAAPWSSSSQV
jgi:hypothetical protein